MSLDNETSLAGPVANALNRDSRKALTAKMQGPICRFEVGIIMKIMERWHPVIGGKADHPVHKYRRRQQISVNLWFHND